MNDCDGSLDLSNLDLKNFQYFRYTQELPNGEVRNVMAPPPSIHDHFRRTKAGKTRKSRVQACLNSLHLIIAVATYFRKLLLGNTAYDAETVSFVVEPNVEHLRWKFQQKYGHRGIYLIESLGRGYVPSIA